MLRLLILALLCIAAFAANADVIVVDRSGSGDFTEIQPAVDVAASGDTIMIGPGRYDEKALIGNPPWQQYARINIVQSELTIIGAGAQETVVGPSMPWMPENDEDRCINFDKYYGAGFLKVADIGFENTGIGIFMSGGAEELDVRGCEFRGNNVALFLWSGRAVLLGCLFDDIENSGYHIVSTQLQLNIDHCEFRTEYIPTMPQVLVHIQSTLLAEISNCTFDGGFGGLDVSLGSEVYVSDSSFFNQGRYGIGMGGSCGVYAQRIIMDGQDIALLQNGRGAVLEFDRVHFRNVARASIVYGALDGGFVRNSSLDRGAKYVVQDVNPAHYEIPEPVHFDMTNNWWGTDDPDSIQAWIFDGADQPDRPYYFIDWWPYRSEPLPAQKASFGDVKSMFR